MLNDASIGIHDKNGKLIYHIGPEKIWEVSNQSLSLLIKGGNKVVLCDFYKR